MRFNTDKTKNEGKWEGTSGCDWEWTSKRVIENRHIKPQTGAKFLQCPHPTTRRQPPSPLQPLTWSKKFHQRSPWAIHNLQGDVNRTVRYCIEWRGCQLDNFAINLVKDGEKHCEGGKVHAVPRNVIGPLAEVEFQSRLLQQLFMMIECNWCVYLRLQYADLYCFTSVNDEWIHVLHQ